MNPKHLYLILKSIENNSSINLLRREGISFSEISQLLTETIEEKYVEYTGEKVVLGERGKEVLVKLNSQFKETDKNLWIEKEAESKISPITIDFIYLPDKNNLSF